MPLPGVGGPRKQRSMNLYLDTEFNGFGGSLISMGIVSDLGHEWYEVSDIPVSIEPWVFENVVPLLGKEPIGEDAFKRSLHLFLKKFSKPVIHVDWYTDAVMFFECMMGKDHSETLNFSCSVVLHSDLHDYPDFAGRHNALEDAKALKEMLT